ncbi:HAMP domain-containing sensor histidine kinase [Nocardia sp. AG03]|uniref:sensor histidine kinase n=1 Tax=Nocardia sp. AG03 TaxID=3025312 RepID=UPI0024187F66|nr:HAMP domain-containing sensor histidine kinase [Nocardia sp. AG03]
MVRPPGLSVRLKLTLSYAGFIMVAGVLLLVGVLVFYLYFLPDGWLYAPTGEFLIDRALLLRSFAPFMAVVLIGLLVFGLLGGWLLAGWMLAPLARITAATRTAADGSLAHRIRLPGRRDELRELADTFDTMLARLEAHVGETQRFAANASHELRTPLAITKTLLDVAAADPARDSAALIERLSAANARAIDLTEALLLLSRAGRPSTTGELVDLSLVAEEATETLLALAEGHGVTLDTGGERALVLGSHALLLQLTTNLVHNAIVHNLAERGTVWVTTGADPGGVALTVENTGAPLRPELVAILVEPFQRGTDRARAHHSGVGLGLAIVDSITRAHAGTLTLTPRAAGGLRVTVRLPVPPVRPLRS